MDHEEPGMNDRTAEEDETSEQQKVSLSLREVSDKMGEEEEAAEEPKDLNQNSETEQAF